MKSNSNTLFMLVIRHIQFQKRMMARNEKKKKKKKKRKEKKLKRDVNLIRRTHYISHFFYIYFWGQ